MTDRNKVCCFSGHRKLPAAKTAVIEEKLLAEIERLILGGVCFFGSGMALGFDLMAGKCVLALKEKYPQIKLIAVLPCRPSEQIKYWSAEQQAEYYSVLDNADKVVAVSNEYYSGCMQKRNRHLVESSGYCVCYLSEKSGGTAMTVELARREALTVINLA